MDQQHTCRVYHLSKELIILNNLPVDISSKGGVPCIVCAPRQIIKQRVL